LQFGAPRGYEVEKRLRKSLRLLTLQDIAHAAVQAPAILRIAVEEKRERLPLQYFWRAQIAPRGVDAPGHGLERLLEEIEIMRPGRGESEDERVPGPTTRTTDALHVVGRPGIPTSSNLDGPGSAVASM
jgi:hypothetical protein